MIDLLRCSSAELTATVRHLVDSGVLVEVKPPAPAPVSSAPRRRRRPTQRQAIASACEMVETIDGGSSVYSEGDAEAIQALVYYLKAALAENRQLRESLRTKWPYPRPRYYPIRGPGGGQ